MTESSTEKTSQKLREWSREVNRGFLEFWVLNLLHRESLYGARICNLLADMTEGRIHCEPGTIYPLLNRLAEKGWIISDIRVRRQGRGPMRRYYRLTDEGSHLLNAMIEHYFETYNALLRMMAAEFRSVRKRLSQLMEDVE